MNVMIFSDRLFSVIEAYCVEEPEAIALSTLQRKSDRHSKRIRERAIS